MDLGLIYMNARYYVAELGRFLSADTIVPDPGNPQSFNRYAYAYNNPLKYTDPSGHCAIGDSACWALADDLYQRYGWKLVGLASNGRWTLEEVQVLWDAATAIELWFANHGGGDALGRMRGALGGTEFTRAGIVGNIVLPGRDHVRGNKVHLLPGFKVSNVVHEIGHVLDNRSGHFFMTALLGGGKADVMAGELGFLASQCWNRSTCGFYTQAAQGPRFRESPPSDYAWSGPSEDFADTFMFSVLSPRSLEPVRTVFMSELGRSLTTSVGEFAGSPYTGLQRSGKGLLAPGIGGGNLLSAHLLY
jgi:RHS repeat-associated protein